MGSVYVIHLFGAVGKAQHYIGYTNDVGARLAEHAATSWEPLPEPIYREDGKIIRGTKTGDGSTLLAVANHRGIRWELAIVFPRRTHKFERQLKRTKKVAPYCPICAKEQGRKPRKYKPKKEALCPTQ